MLKVHVQYLKSRKKTLSEGLEVVQSSNGENCVWRTKQERSINNIDINQGSPFFIYFFISVYVRY